MSEALRAGGRLDVWVHWAGVALGTAMFGLSALFFVGEGLLGEEPLRLGALTTVERLLFVAFFAMALGALAAWRWTLAGGILVLLGGASFVAINSAASGRVRVGLFPALYLVAGVLLVASRLFKETP